MTGTLTRHPRNRRQPVKDKPADWTTDDWSTPARLVRELGALYGPFDLDPCTRAETAKAPVYFTIADDGLEQPWFGRVWLNPPYSNPTPWLCKSIDETRSGRATSVCALLPGDTSTAWFHDLVLPHAQLHFLRGRVHFIGWMGTGLRRPTSGNIVAVYRRPPTVTARAIRLDAIEATA